MKITKAVIAAAGLGTRFLPETKSVPKEMLPIIDRPIIHYLVDELVQSGIKDIILITRPGFNTYADYFSKDAKLEKSLLKSGKTSYAKQIKDISKMAKIICIPQPLNLPYGNASPLIAAKKYIKKGESFVYMFGDDMTISKTPVSKQIINVFQKHRPNALLAVQKVPWEEVPLYGAVEYKKGAPYRYEITKLIEKPSIEEAPSRMVQFGRFVLTYDVLKETEKTSLGKGKELWMSDVLNKMAKEGKKVIAQPIRGKWLTTGDPLRFIKTTLEFAMQRPDLKAELRYFIKNGLK